MLTSYPKLDSTFSNPVAACPSLSHSSSGNESQPQQQQTSFCFQLPAEHHWLGSCATNFFPKDVWCASSEIFPRSKPEINEEEEAKPPKVMQVIEPEDDLKCLINNDLKLRLCGYYYGSLSWSDAAHILKKCNAGTFLVRDSEHSSYLYALSVQTRKGPTSCRIEYSNGRFRLDSCQELSNKMPRFESVTDLVDHYVQMTKNLPRNTASKEVSPVWLNLDEENTRDIPVQIYKPLYRTVQSLQHICRINLIRIQRERHPNWPLSRTINESEHNVLPTVLKDYLKEYPYSQ
ncbi:suppressor of cytokine signaling 2-like [Uloborus diversus]|uniref:suppressor of cytokine signaling 2-like n=1 Tax=Uloborus diversus TaxID=327109 RepID=UPI0024094AAC|nr:suppressor of cytokine signaling 2-like [Uloborus diversus]